MAMESGLPFLPEASGGYYYFTRSGYNSQLFHNQRKFRLITVQSSSHQYALFTILVLELPRRQLVL